MASRSTGMRDYTIKRGWVRAVRRTGILANRTRRAAVWHDVELAGDFLADGVYAPIPIERSGDGLLRGYSSALGLYVCWEYGNLRFYDPEEGRYLSTHREVIEALAVAEARADSADARADAAEARNRYLEDQLRRYGLGDQE